MTGVLHRINPLSYRISISLAHGFNGRYIIIARTHIILCMYAWAGKRIAVVGKTGPKYLTICTRWKRAPPARGVEFRSLCVFNLYGQNTSARIHTHDNVALWIRNRQLRMCRIGLAKIGDFFLIFRKIFCFWLNNI